MKSMSKIRSQIKQEIKENLKQIILGIFLSSIAVIILPASVFYGAIAVTAKETMLKALIEAEATILGFFGLIVVYALTSFDNRTDKLESWLFDLTEKGRHTEVPEIQEYFKSIGVAEVVMTKGQILIGELHDIQRKRRKTIRSASIVGIYLVLSLLLSIFALGMPNVVFEAYSCITSVGLFFSAIVFLFLMFHDLAGV